ncbi:putative thiol peroxidase [Clostridia bacterium]|nr:putative thiol peroxidase [Clostridia bacterium]
MENITFRGTPIKLKGNFPKIGQTIQNFTLTGTDLTDVDLNSFGQKRKVLNIFPSIDTGVCATSVRTFNQKASSLDNTVVLCISADLPFASGRFCAAEDIKNVTTLSTFRYPEFLTDVGVLVDTLPIKGLACRAVIVLDSNNQVLYAEQVEEIANEPNYEAALSILS